MFDWTFFIYIALNAIVCSWIALQTSRWYDTYRDKQFLKHLQMQFSDGTVVMLQTVETSNAKALRELKRQLSLQ